MKKREKKINEIIQNKWTTKENEKRRSEQRKKKVWTKVKQKHETMKV